MRRRSPYTHATIAVVLSLLTFPAWATADLELELGLGYDSNPFLTPRESYFDQNSLQDVEPVRESGLYLPFRLTGDLGLDLPDSSHRFVTEYRLRGDFYPDSSTENAEETYARIRPGFQFDLGTPESRRERVLHVGPFVSYNKEIFFDRDTGLGAELGELAASDRYTYTALGGEVALDYELSRALRVSVEAVFERRGYEDVAGISSFDHDRYRAETELALRLARSARLYVEYAYQVRDYEDRTAKQLDGSSLDSNPRLEYSYRVFGTTLRLRPVRVWTVDLQWQRTLRSDEFVGYNDYTQRRYRLRSTIRGEKRRLRFTAEYRDRSFDDAFIFDQPFDPRDGSANPKKDYETVRLELSAEADWTRHARLFAKLQYRDEKTTDPRFSYERTEMVTGIRWTF